VIMGFTTFKSIIDAIGKPLPKRHNFVLTRSPDKRTKEFEEHVLAGHVTFGNNAEELLEKAWDALPDKVDQLVLDLNGVPVGTYEMPAMPYLCGGNSVYEGLAHAVTHLVHTTVHEVHEEGDVEFDYSVELLEGMQLRYKRRTDDNILTFEIFER